MSKDLEFLKGEVARLKVELILGSSPLQKLSIKNEIDETEKIIAILEDGSVTPETSGASEINTINNPKAQPPKNKPVPPVKVNKISLYKITEAVIAGFLVLCIAWVVAHYFGLQL